jgi:putative ABC transport system ATP-binding protein
MAHAATHHGPASHTPPLRRLVDLLRPERTDISVVIVFAVVVGVLNLAVPIAVEALVNTVAFGRLMQPLFVLGVMLFTFLSFAALLRGLQAYIAEVIQRRLFVRVVADLAHRLPRVKQEALDGRHGPELMNRFFDVMTVQKSAALLVLEGVAIVLQAVVGMMVLAFYHPYLLGFNIVLLTLIGIGIFVLGRGAVTTKIDESYAKYAVASWLEQLAQFINSGKLDGENHQAIARADSLAVDYIQCRKAHFRVLMRQIAFALALQAIAATALLGIGGLLVIQGQLTLGQLVAAELIVTVVVGSFAKMGKHMESFYDLLAAVDKLGHLFDLPVERDGGLAPRTGERGAEIKLHDATLTYANGISALARTNLRIGSGEVVVLSGPPGSGKTTLMDMLFGLREPTHGYIEYDGEDVRSLDLTLLRHQVVLLREIEIFEGSISENVHLSRPGIDQRRVHEVLTEVGLLRELMYLPQGLNTQICPKGTPLSGSQAVRLMLARALAGQPRLVLIDSLLDRLPDDSLVPILRTLNGRNGERTVVLITGRDSLGEACDRIVKLSPAGRPHPTRSESDQSPEGDMLELSPTR